MNRRNQNHEVLLRRRASDAKNFIKRKLCVWTEPQYTQHVLVLYTGNANRKSKDNNFFYTLSRYYIYLNLISLLFTGIYWLFGQQPQKCSYLLFQCSYLFVSITTVININSTYATLENILITLLNTTLITLLNFNTFIFQELYATNTHKLHLNRDKTNLRCADWRFKRTSYDFFMLCFS